MNKKYTELHTAICNYVDVLYIAGPHLYADGQQWMSIHPRYTSMWFMTAMWFMTDKYGIYTMAMGTIVRCINLFLNRQQPIYTTIHEKPVNTVV